MYSEKKLDFAQAKDKALRLLGFRSHSEFELETKLKRAGASEEDISEVMSFLREYKFVNDADYAKRLAKDLQNLKKFGEYRIKQELKKRGIASEYIDEALLELEDFEEEVLLPLVEKRLGGNFERKNIDKIMRYFSYRGYSFDDIKRCVEIIKEKEEF